MRALTAVFVSICLHVALLWLGPYYYGEPLKPPNRKDTVLNVRLSYEETVRTDILESKTKRTSLDKHALITPALAINTALAQREESRLQTSVENKSETKAQDDLGSYFSSATLDRKALPISNIDVSMFKSILLSSMPVRLRLYVNASGRVVKVLMQPGLQDEQMGDRLVSLLYEMTFIPARKNNMDVDSYQDVELSFSPIISASP